MRLPLTAGRVRLPLTAGGSEATATVSDMASLIDWDLAASTAKRMAPAPPDISPAEAEAAVTELRACAEVAAVHVAELTRLAEPPVTALTRVVDRPGWVDVNASGMATLMNPLVEKLSGSKKPSALADAVGGKVTGAQAGAVLGFMSGKVLGQFEFFDRADGQLLLVAPNIVDVERKLQVDPSDFRLWVCLHEVTHRVQFTAVPWMRQHMLDRGRRPHRHRWRPIRTCCARGSGAPSASWSRRPVARTTGPA